MCSTETQVLKQCTCCGKEQQWRSLKYIGRMDLSEEGVADLELRNCDCGSTLAMEVMPEPTEIVAWDVMATVSPKVGHSRVLSLRFEHEADAKAAALAIPYARTVAVYAEDLPHLAICSRCEAPAPRPGMPWDICDACFAHDVEEFHRNHLRLDGWCSECRTYIGDSCVAVCDEAIED